MFETMYFLFISGAEIFVILVIVLVLFGADKIPEIARGLGKGMRQIKDATNDIKREISDTAEKHGFDTELTKNIEEQINTIQEDIDEVTGPIKRNL